MTYSYKIVEAALMQLHDIPAECHGAFKGRLTNLRRMGMTPIRPGKGRAIIYSFEDVAKLALSLEFAQFGMDPSVYTELVSDKWNDLKPQSIASPYSILMFKPGKISDPSGWIKTLQMADSVKVYSILSGRHSPHLAMIDVERLYATLATVLDDSVLTLESDGNPR